MMPETQDKTTEDESNMFHVHFVFIFEAFSMTDGIPKEKKNLQWSHPRNLFLVRHLSENRIKRCYG